MKSLPASTFRLGDCLEVMAAMPDASVDAIVTDPPYELGFMGKTWDSSGIAYSVPMWAEALRVLKPGGHLLAFGGTRTYHRMTVAIEDAGFEIRDSIHWIYGSGFPKSLDVSKAIDKAAGATREQMEDIGGSGMAEHAITAPATPEAAVWTGWGTALKPAHEPIVVARKPLIGTVAANVLEHGTGALNIDATRIETTDDLNGGAYSGDRRQRDEYSSADTAAGAVALSRLNRGVGEYVAPAGRWPANVIFDEAAAAELDAQTGSSTSRRALMPLGKQGTACYGDYGTGESVRGYDDQGGASRFFYCAKAGTKERPIGPDGTKHATVKPLALMRWLVRLVTPPGGLVLDPFAGSGTTLEAALLEGFDCFGIEAEITHVPLVLARIDRARAA